MQQSRQSRALIVDDQPGIAALIEEALSLNGWECTVLTDPLALESALQNQFELVVCDFKMPGQTGLEVLRYVRQHQPELVHHFILMTGNPAEAENHHGELYGVPVLVKPFKLAQLLQAVEKLK